MIPKVIHYCWFSDKPGYPDDLRKFLDSWKKHLPDYEIKLWNVDNFDVNQSNDYVKEAMAEGKYAFVSDFVRLWALYNYGGVYLDSDVEVFKSFDPLLDCPGFIGFESDKSVASCLIASEVNNPLLKELMTAYNDRHFITEDGRLDLTPNPFPITKCLIKHGLKINNELQRLDNMVVYPQTFFVHLILIIQMRICSVIIPMLCITTMAVGKR
ncbi:MAG: glycosyltransferase [Selenomonadaceae bacterium]|nr:glycosyltransferase [Selenomonadaceae bacterium]